MRVLDRNLDGRSDEQASGIDGEDDVVLRSFLYACTEERVSLLERRPGPFQGGW
jgi:hypothetical protein